ncbi:hypothetical protein [Ruficoccus sp. ZRK36]|uniref:hypothetical protein n=1 Tax=Ruficoccus sp. ZRK36 TaxID=2866311 RepID=UPI001C73720D|nr:hypothetical protein [Ruficoccus sp. ZRK36]QYY37307.1 hypothetical protein K0V07_07430 [Ruficoccus sp. ZRK36]
MTHLIRLAVLIIASPFICALPTHAFWDKLEDLAEEVDLPFSNDEPDAPAEASAPAVVIEDTPVTYSPDTYQQLADNLPPIQEKYETDVDAINALLQHRNFLELSLNEIEELNELIAEINRLLGKALDDVRSGHKIQEQVLADLKVNLNKLQQRVEIVKYQEQGYGEIIAAQHIYQDQDTALTLEDLETLYMGDINESILSQQALQKELAAYKTEMKQKDLDLSDFIVVLNNAKISSQAVSRYHVESTATCEVATYQINFRLNDLNERAQTMQRAAEIAEKGTIVGVTVAKITVTAVVANNVDTGNRAGDYLGGLAAGYASEKALKVLFEQLGIDPETMRKQAQQAQQEAKKFQAFEKQARVKIAELNQGLDKLEQSNKSTQELVDSLEEPLQVEVAERIKTDADLAELYAAEQERASDAASTPVIIVSQK